jgi:hypothetical protein
MIREHDKETLRALAADQPVKLMALVPLMREGLIEVVYEKYRARVQITEAGYSAILKAH